MYIGLRAADVQGKGWIAVSRSCSFRVRQWVNLLDNNYDEFSEALAHILHLTQLFQIYFAILVTSELQLQSEQLSSINQSEGSI